MANQNDKPKQKKYALPLSDELGTWISNFAAEQDVSVAEVVRRALNSYKDAQTKAA